MSSGPRIVVSGYYGFGNAGDEAVLAGLIDTFRETFPEASLVVASGDPEGTHALHGVDTFDRYRWQDFRGNMRTCDAFLSGGGSLFQDATSRRSIYYYLGTLALAEFYRRPTMICGQGIGPISAGAARAVTSALFNRAELITVRDPDSLETLKGLGVTRPPIHLTADPVFALQPSPPEKAHDILRWEGVDLDRPRVALALRSWPPGPEMADLRRRRTEPDGRAAEGDALLNAAAEAAAFIHHELGAQVVFVPMHPPADHTMAKAVAERAGVPCVVLRGGYPPRDVLSLIGEMDLVVAMRLHALIFAAVRGVQLVGISYDPKVDGFLRLLGRTPASDLASIRGEVLAQSIGRAWQARHEESSLLAEKARTLREKALENGTLLSALLGCPAGTPQ